MINSEEYLRQAFSEEYQARRRYLAFAGQAEKEGFPEIARLFRDAAREAQAQPMTISLGDWKS